jgi:hypothetical protein
MLRPRATNAGPVDAEAVVSLGGRDSVFPIRSASPLQRLSSSPNWMYLLGSAKACLPEDRVTCAPVQAIAGRFRARSTGAHA